MSKIQWPHPVASAMMIAFVLMAGIADANEAAHNKILKSIVYLSATAEMQIGNHANTEQKRSATGFVVGDDGFILTSYHLIADIQRGAGTGLKISAAIGDDSPADFRPVEVVSYARILDFLLLKIERGVTEKFTPVEFGDSSMVTTGTNLFVSGFPLGKYERKNANFNVGKNLFWKFNTSIVDGQSGSPIYDQRGHVVGLIKGSFVGNESVAAVAPIELADSILAHLKLERLENDVELIKQILGELPKDILENFSPEKHSFLPRLTTMEKGMQDVKKFVAWKCELEPSHSLVVSYQKPAKGDEAVKRIRYSITPHVIREISPIFPEGFEGKGFPFNTGTENRISSNDDTIRGAFRIPSILDQIKDAFKEELDLFEVNKMYVEFKPYWASGQAMQPQKCLLNLESPFRRPK